MMHILDAYNTACCGFTFPAPLTHEDALIMRRVLTPEAERECQFSDFVDAHTMYVDSLDAAIRSYL